MFTEESKPLLEPLIDTHNSSFDEIATMVYQILNSNSIELVRFTLPPIVLHLPEKLVLSQLNQLKNKLNPALNNSRNYIDEAGLILSNIARQVVIIEGGKANDLMLVKSRTQDIITSILFNFGGSNQLEGNVSDRLIKFVDKACENLPPYCNNQKMILENSKNFNLAEVYKQVNLVLQNLDIECAVQHLQANLPEELMMFSTSNDILTSLLIRWINLVNITAGKLENQNDSQANKIIAHSISELLNIVVFLASDEPLNTIISLTQTWVTNFFHNACIGKTPNINVSRLLKLLKTGANLSECNLLNQNNLDSTSYQNKLTNLGVNTRNIEPDVLEPLYHTLVSGNDEMFTARPILNNGKISSGLGIIVKKSQDHGIHVFVYDTEKIKTWINRQNTIPETRERFIGRIITIS